MNLFKRIFAVALKEYMATCSPEELDKERLARETRLRDELLTNDLDRIFGLLNPLATIRMSREDIAHGLINREDIGAVLMMSERVRALMEWQLWRTKLLEWNPEERLMVPETMTFEEFHSFFSDLLHAEWAKAAKEKAQKEAEEDTAEKRAKALENDVMYRRNKLAFDLIDEDGNGTLSGRELLMAVQNKETVEALQAASPALSVLMRKDVWFKSFMKMPTDRYAKVKKDSEDAL